MRRTIIEQLLQWKQNPSRKPLILHGARQVGKTWAILDFGHKYYKNIAWFDLEDIQALPAIFEADFDPRRIVRELSAIAGVSILKGDTLIFFDEIQACERALTSLKYFYEREPDYHIIAAGSLLGLALKREKYSFPVGKVDMFNLYPLDFEEFLAALGQEELATLIREHFEHFRPFSLHEKALEWYRLYLAVGGMPRPVTEYIDKKDFNFVQMEQKTLNASYIADMAKYADPQETTRILASWSSVPAQLAKDNRKFQYSFIKSGGRSHEYELSIHWLKAAGIIHLCIKVPEGKPPLSAYAQNNIFKVYMADTGLLCSKFEISANLVLSGNPRFNQFKGPLTENYVAQALSANGIVPYYWESPGKAELDFVFQDRQGNVIPLEVKSSRNVRSRSLARFMELYKPPYAIRVSERNFGFENGIKSLPLYSVFCLEP
jgi:predicted AAA+ superfamily ATPase